MSVVKPIPGYDGYAATDEGLVITYWRRESMGFGRGSRAIIGATGRPLRPFDRKLISGEPSGYLSVSVKHSDGRVRNRYVHELVLYAFAGPRPTDAHEALHGDNVRSNNAASNLRWGTTKENTDDRERAGHILRGDAWYRARGLPPPWLADELASQPNAAAFDDARGPFDDLLGEPS